MNEQDIEKQNIENQDIENQKQRNNILAFCGFVYIYNLVLLYSRKNEDEDKEKLKNEDKEKLKNEDKEKLKNEIDFIIVEDID